MALIAENISKAEQTNKIFSIKFSRFSHLLNDSVCERNFQTFFWNTSNSMASTFLGLNRCERKLLRKFTSFSFESEFSDENNFDDSLGLELDSNSVPSAPKPSECTSYLLIGRPSQVGCSTNQWHPLVLNCPRSAKNC
jgi:hypothetical protein